MTSSRTRRRPAAPGRRPLRIPGQGILLANLALVFVGVVLLDVNLFSRQASRR